MMRTTWVWVLGTLFLSALVACTSGGGGGGDDDDDDDISIGDDDDDNGGDGDADADSDTDSDADTDGDADGDADCGPDDPNADPPEIDPGCAPTCANFAGICEGGDEAHCLEVCGRAVRVSPQGPCLDAYRAYMDCVANATDCPNPEEGVQGCDTQIEAAGTACANGCGDIIECFQGCPANDNACYEACYTDGSAEGRAAWDAAAGCFEQHCADIPENDDACIESCLDANCGDELATCR
ncbi:MAG: hypothetical protein HYY06_13765 [Deltaproteobacteria bacterium]|nr:hypothetical protein [Deltaproteobacteria bacterium]